MRNTRSQGFNIDTSLLDSIRVLDSNVGASYGGFLGGVVEANVRTPRRGWHWDISYQHTSNKLTQYHIDDEVRANYENSSDEKYQPRFTKHLVKASVEGFVNDHFGILGAFSTTRSFIGLNGYSETFRANKGDERFEQREQKRISDNFYLKSVYYAGDALTLEGTLAYMPQSNTYYSAITKDSFYAMKSGGYQAGLKAVLDADTGV